LQKVFATLTCTFVWHRFLFFFKSEAGAGQPCYF
jgi:hypothetical protein